MLTQIFHKALSLALAMVVLFSTFSFTVNKHYCGKSLIDTAVVFAAETCGMEIRKPVENSGCSITKKGCCSEDQLLVDGQDQLKHELSELSSVPQLLVFTNIITHLISLEGFKRDTPDYRAHAPPSPERPIYKLYERYLI